MRWLVFNIPPLFLLNAVFGMYGIVWAQVMADTLTVLLSLWVLRRCRPALPPRAGNGTRGLTVNKNPAAAVRWQPPGIFMGFVRL